MKRMINDEMKGWGMDFKFRHILYVGCILMPLFFSACATPVKVPAPIVPAPAPMVPVAIRQDVFHVVAPGENLWRISKMYDVLPVSIATANHLSMEPVLKKGMRLLIPRAAPIMPVITLYPSTKWSYIIIHHSATDEGDSLLFDKAHLNKGWDGVGYDFVIDNGTKGRVDGQIEVSPRWLKQISGAHCKADGMNERAIGICLVGNFNNEEPTPRQLQALRDLLRKLKDYYKIADNHVMGHGQVKGAKTDCPGKKFPWHKL